MERFLRVLFARPLNDQPVYTVSSEVQVIKQISLRLLRFGWVDPRAGLDDMEK
jgi:hypothetical protein